LTIEAWVKRIGTQTNYANIISEAYTSYSTPFYEFVLGMATLQKVRFGVVAGGVWTQVVSANPIPDGVWVHLVSVYDGSYLRLYINRVAETPVSLTGNINDYGRPLFIGRYEYATDLFFKGLIDEVRIYKRVLSSDEISDLYNNYGYTTTNYLGKVLVKKITTPEPTVTVGAEEHVYPPSISFSDFAFAYNFEGYQINATAKYTDVILFNGSTYDYYIAVNETARNFFKTVKLQGAPWKWKINATAKGAGGTVSSVKTLTVVALLFDDFTFTYNYDGYRIYATGYNVDSVMFNGSRYDSAIPADSGTQFSKTIRLPAGIWKINVTATGLGKTTTVIRTVTVNKAKPALNLYLNGKAGNITVAYGETVNITAFENNQGDSDVAYCLYLDNALLDCGPRITSMLRQPTIGKYKITYLVPEGQNYTSNSVSYYLVVTGATGKSAEEAPPVAVSPPPAVNILPPLAGLHVVISIDDPSFLFLLVVLLLVIMVTATRKEKRLVVRG
jgi:hypothetical protein